MSTYDDIRKAAEDVQAAREAHRLAHGTGNGKIRIDPAIALQILAWIVGVILVYGAVNTRVSVLETKYDSLKESLTLINLKLDRIMEQK